MPLTFIQGGLALSPVQLSEGLPSSYISQAFKCAGSRSLVFVHFIRNTACEEKMIKMGICKQIVRMVSGQISEVLRYLTTMQRTNGRPVQGPAYGWINSECFKMKVVHQRVTDRAHHKGLHDKWGIGIINRTAESF